MINSRVLRWLISARGSLRAQLWPLPTIGIAVAVAVGVLLPRLDAHIDGGLPGWLREVIFDGDAGAARTVLDAVASSLITVTALTFSLTVVTLQLASSQFSPRLLRTFARDLFVQATLALFLATFVYSLTVLRTVRNPDDNGASAFVPRLSVTVSFLLSVLSVLGLVLFLAHLARQIRVETMLRNVHQDAIATIRQTLVKPNHQHPAGPAVLDAPPHARIILAPPSGFLVEINESALLAAATQHDAVMILHRHPGDFLVEDTPIGVYWSRTATPDTDWQDEFTARVRDAIHTGPERTESQDIGYGLRQLTDVVIKALSPGINDPTTAVHALSHSAGLLRELADRDLTPVVLADEAGVTRVHIHRPTLAELLDEALTQPRRYGANDPLVLARLYSLLAEVAWRSSPQHHPAISRQLERLDATVAQQNFDPTESTQLGQLRSAVEHAITASADRSP
jgi:uncharacterized membrane protein